MVGEECLKMDWLASLLCSLGILASCATPSPVTIIDPMAYLALDLGGHRQTVNDPLGRRRYDYGHYQETDSFQLDATHAVTTWDYVPFRAYDIPNDGGEQYVIEGDTVRIEGTRDGGKPFNQYFVGKGCGGTGWVVFKTDADSSWRQLVSTLSIAPAADQCSAKSKSLTRYTRQTVTFPALGRRDTIISEHYNAGRLNDAKVLERSFFVAGFGRVAWQAFANYQSPLSADELARRCPNFGWQVVGNLHLVDCRISDQIDLVESAVPGSQMWALGK